MKAAIMTGRQHPADHRRLRRSAARLPALFLALLLSAATLPAQAPRRSSGPSAEYRPVLYAVEGGSAPFYLYGSLHIAPAEVVPPPAAARAAFAQSDRLLTEVLLNEETEQEAGALMMARAFFEDGSVLSDYLTPGQARRIELLAEELNLPMAGIEAMQPWAVELLFSEGSAVPPGFSAQNGLDRYFVGKANARGMELGGLETTEEQMDALSGGSIEEQLASLVATLESDPRTAILELYESWRTADMEGLERIVEESMATAGASWYDRLLTERNRLWVERMEELLQDGVPTFVVVGAAHLVGNDSVQRMLEEDGYEIRRILTPDQL